MEESKRRVQIPAVDIQYIIDRHFDHISRFLQLEIILRSSHIDKADIIIAVRRREPPRTAAGFHGVENPDILLLFQLGKRLQNFVPHGLTVFRSSFSSSVNIAFAHCQCGSSQPPFGWSCYVPTVADGFLRDRQPCCPTALPTPWQNTMRALC